MANVIAAVLTIATSFIPGLLLSFALLKNTSFGKWDKIFFGMIAAMFAVPLLSLLELMVLGIPLNFMLVFANALLVSLASLALLHYQKQSFSIPKLHFPKDFDAKNFLLKNSIPFILILLLVCSFYVRR